MGLKVALIYSGQMRSFKNCITSQKKSFINKYNPDIFIQTTVTNYDKIVDKNVLRNQINETYDNVKKLVIMDETLDIWVPIENFGYPKDHIFEGCIAKNPNQGFNGRERQFHKLKLVNQLRKDYEKENGFEYDVVVRCRTDIQLYQDINIEKEMEGKSDNSVILQKYYNGTDRNIIDDNFAFGKGSAMDIYCGTWDKLRTYEKELFDMGFPNYGSCESQLRRHLERNNVNYYFANNGSRFLQIIR